MRRQQFLRIWFREYLPDYTILIWPQALSTNWVACHVVLAVHNVQLAKWAYCLMASWRRQNIARIVYSAVKQMQFKNVFAEYSVTWALFCYNNIVYFAASIVFQSIDDNHWSNIFYRHRRISFSSPSLYDTVYNMACQQNISWPVCSQMWYIHKIHGNYWLQIFAICCPW